MPNILELVSVQSNSIRTLCDVLKETLNDVNFVFTEDGLKVMAMDGSNVALIHLKLYADRFEHYYCKHKIYVGLNMSIFFKLIKTITNTDTVCFYIDSENTHEFCVKIENADKNSNTLFKLKMLDIDEDELKIPDIELESVITMPSNEFQRICRDMMNISDSIKIESTDNHLKLSCEGEFASQETVIGETTHGLNVNKNTTTIGGRYSLKYINLFTKSTNLSNTLDIYLKNDFPLMLKYNVANLGDITFILASYND
tara:strand:- start:154 stop:921 length:768 start_codon:yes stop_codon:yes gene_type:complete